jgi:hypothetical protein
MADEEKIIVKVTPDGRASIDANALFRDQSEREALHRLSGVIQKQLRRRREQVKKTQGSALRGL